MLNPSLIITIEIVCMYACMHSFKKSQNTYFTTRRDTRQMVAKTPARDPAMMMATRELAIGAESQRNKWLIIIIIYLYSAINLDKIH